MQKNALFARALFLIFLLGNPQVSYSAEKKSGIPFIIKTATSLEKIFKDTKKVEWDKEDKTSDIQISACKGESESFQIVVVPRKELSNLRWQVISSLPGENIKVQPVGYVYIEKPLQPTFAKDFPEQNIRAGWWPDPLYSTWKNIPRLKANENQPLWITISVPRRAKAGQYKIRIILLADGTNKQVVSVRLKVWDFALPERMHLKTSFWYATYQLRDYYPEKIDIWETEKKFLKMALDHRITPVTFQTQYPGNDLVTIGFSPETKQYSFDFSGMKKRLSFIFEENDNKGAFVDILGHYYGFGYTVTLNVNGQRTQKKFLPFTDEYADFTSQHIAAWKKFLETNGWSKYAYAGFIDEPQRKDWEKVRWMSSIIRKAAPDLKTIAAINYMPSFDELKDDIDIIIPGFFSNFTAANLNEFEKAQREGKELWGYICYKTSCINYQSIDHRIWTWICWKYNLKGFLYWGIHNWSQGIKGPVQKIALFVASAQNRWPNKGQWGPTDFDRGVPGDGYLIYPSPEGEPWSSIRLENIRDGIEDYEYLSLLQENIAYLRTKGKKYKKVIEQAEALLEIGPDIIKAPTEYAADYRKILERREKLGDLIETTNKIIISVRQI